MNIFYGVQATGNGHITRARILGRALEREGAEITWLFTGRPPEKLFSMEEFGEYQTRKGMTFVTRRGRISHYKTAGSLSPRAFLRDIFSLDLSGYDLAISDFEPVTAWASRVQKRPCVGISHQNAFRYPVPVEGQRPLPWLIMSLFAPSTIPVGLHWHPFAPPILPPIIDTDHTPGPSEAGKILVYLPFEDPATVERVLHGIKHARFMIYCGKRQPRNDGHLHFRPFSRRGFQNDLATCEGVICGAGFELTSEAIHLGKKLLVKPVTGQMEQLSNARALELLGFGSRMNSLDRQAIEDWLDAPMPARFFFPDTASELARWMTSGRTESLDALSSRLWARAGLHIHRTAGRDPLGDFRTRRTGLMKCASGA